MKWQGSAEAWWDMTHEINDTVRVAIEAVNADRRAELVRAGAEREGGPTTAVMIVSAVREDADELAWWRWACVIMTP